MTVIIEFFKQNIGTVAVLAILAAILVLIAVRMIRRRLRGGSGCGCGCSDCPMSGRCHANTENKEQKF